MCIHNWVEWNKVGSYPRGQNDMLCHIVKCYIVWHHGLTYHSPEYHNIHVMSYHISSFLYIWCLPYHITACQNLSYRIISYCVMPFHTIPHHTISHQVISYHTVLCQTMSHHIIPKLICKSCNYLGPSTRPCCRLNANFWASELPLKALWGVLVRMHPRP